MAYQAAMPAAIYLASALLLRVTSGYPFPLLPVAAWIAANTLVQPAVNWSIPNRIVTVLGNLAAGLAWLGLARYRLEAEYWTRPIQWPRVFDFPLTDYALIALIGLASFGVTVAGVTRQRHGDARAGIPWTGTGFPEWLVNLFRFQCPTSSATRAEVWFELKSRGLPVLAIGVVLAIVNPLLFAVSVPSRAPAPSSRSLRCSPWPAVPRRQCLWDSQGPGRWSVSAFEATQPNGTARLAGLKVLVRSVCVLAALVAVGVSVWASLSFIAVGKGYEPLPGYQPLRSWQGAIESAVGALTGYQQIALAVVASIGVVVMVASHAAFVAIAARHAGRRERGRREGAAVLGIAGWLVVLHGLVLVPLVLTGYRGVGLQALWEFLLGALVW